jgi:hypothetical protein
VSVGVSRRFWVVLALLVAVVGVLGAVSWRGSQNERTLTAEQLDQFQALVDVGMNPGGATPSVKGESRVCVYGPYRVTLYYECPDEDPLAAFRSRMGSDVGSARVSPRKAPTSSYSGMTCGFSAKAFVCTDSDGRVVTKLPVKKSRPATATAIEPPFGPPEPPTGPSAPPECAEGYSPCLPPAADYDCKYGNGDGPEYTGEVIILGGYDPYGLDADNDGIGCNGQ